LLSLDIKTGSLKSDELNHTVYLALGANLGDRRANLNEALQRLWDEEQLHLTCLSRLYETAPVGYLTQPRFLNMVVEAQTSFTPLELLDYAKQIEAELGRKPDFSNSPRPIDIDILFYDALILEEERLQLPHPRMRGRGFVFVPLAEIAPNLVHTGLHRTVTELLDEIKLKPGEVVCYTAEPALELPRMSYDPEL
jgi:2-amino-4-hydroxy-6-hydroxymethyldihydropteridine diphosphokinase